MPNDFWDDHDLGKRLIIIATTLAFLATVGAALYGIAVDQNIVLMVGVLTFTSFVSLSLGIEGTKKLLLAIVEAFKRK